MNRIQGVESQCEGTKNGEEGETMFRKSLIGFVLTAGLVFNAAAAEVFVRIAPPVDVVEKRGVAPSHGHVWIAGYHRWDVMLMSGSLEDGNCRRARTLTGSGIAGFTAAVVMF
jgi:hypothetical protein